MIHKIDDGFVVVCEVCLGGMDEDGRTEGNISVFADKNDAGVFVSDCHWDRIGDYTVCPDCVGKINRGEVELWFIDKEEAGK